jgi:hypothetical protein
MVWEGMEWIDLRQVRHKWRAVVNEVRSLQVPSSSGNLDWLSNYNNINVVRPVVLL